MCNAYGLVKDFWHIKQQIIDGFHETHSHNWKATKVIDNNGLVLTTVYLVLGKRYL